VPTNAGRQCNSRKRIKICESTRRARQTRKGLRAQCRCIVGGNCVNIVTGAVLCWLWAEKLALASLPWKVIALNGLPRARSYMYVCVQRHTGKHKNHTENNAFSFISLYLEFNYFAINFISCWYELLQQLNYPGEFIEELAHNYSAQTCVKHHIRSSSCHQNIDCEVLN
jgi:hypothetical protein